MAITAYSPVGGFCSSVGGTALLGLVWFGLVRIRPLRSVLTISEPWDEGNGFEWAKVDVARVAETGLWRLPPPAPCRVCAPQARSTTTAGGRLGDRHMPGGRRPLGLANGGVTEDWG